MSTIKEYFLSRIFWKNIAIALSIVTFTLIITATCTRIYTHHDRSYAVPDFSNMLLKDAIKLAEKKNLQYEIFDSLFVKGKEPTTIIDQHPKPGFLVKKNRTIFFTINASAPDKIAMPNLVGVTLRESKARLESFGLLLGILSYRYDISKNVVLEQRCNGKVIQAGDTIPKGSYIDLVLGKGLANSRESVPNLVGMTLDQAKIKLADALFSLGAEVTDESFDRKDPSAVTFIYKQKPASAPGIKVPLGSTITVWISADSTKLPGMNEDDNKNVPDDDMNNDEDSDTTTYSGSYTD